MLIKSVTILCLIALSHSATIQKRDIPVEVIYEEPGSEGSSVKNSDEKIQLSAKELKDATTNEIKDESEQKLEDIVDQRLNAVKNLDEKVQLSPDELSQAIKRIPIEDNVEEATSLTKLGELPKIEEITPAPILNVEGVLQQAEEIISSGLKKLRVSFKPDKNQLGPNAEQWENLEKAVNEYLTEEKTKLQLKQQQPAQPGQPPQGFFQNIATGFQTIANNFVQNLSGSQITANTTNQGDEQQGGNQGGFQGFVSFFQGGVNNIANTISSLGGQGPTTSNTVLGDPGTGATTQAPGFISNFVSNVQQFFGQIQGGTQSGGASGIQGDTGVANATASGPQGPVQVIQSIGSAINQFIQGNRPPGTSGDEGTATTETNIIQSIGNVIHNSPLNPFRPQTQKPGETVSQNPIQAGISGVQNVGNQIQQLIPGQSSTETAKQPEDQIAVEQNNQVVEELPATKGVNPEGVKEENAETEKEGIKQQETQQEQMEEEIKQEEIKEEMKQEEMKEKILQEEIKQEEIKQEEIKEQEIKREEIKQEEIKEQEIKQEEIKQEEIKQEIKQEEIKQEELKEEAKEEIKKEVEDTIKQEEINKEEKKEEILMTAE